MARKLRIQYPGAIYHVMSRGDRREAIFKDDSDRERFLATLGETCAKTAWQVHAYCLMSNHFHMVIETPQANLVAGMKWFLGTYTSRFNRRHKLFGHLFSGRYKSLVVDGSGNGYLKTVCDYVHLNPCRAHLLEREQAIASYRWSSYPLYLKSPPQRPPWLRVDRLLGEWAVQRDDSRGRRRFAAEMEARRASETNEEFEAVRRGWCMGGKEFREELLEQIEEERREWHSGAEIAESDEQHAQRIIERALKKKRWTADELRRRRKGDPFKVQLADQLRKETTMTLKWIAGQLHMGTRGHLAHLLYWHGCSTKK
jgi:putative transposase